MKMSIITAVVAAVSSTITPLVSASIRSPTTQTLSVHHKRIANTAKRRRPTATLYNGIHTKGSSNNKHISRRRALSSALQSSTQHTAFISHYPSIRHLSNSNNHNNPPDENINWTPICERYLNQAYNQIASSSKSKLQISPQGTEGFRDAIRGGQEYIKPRGGSRVESQTQTQYEKEIAASPQSVQKIVSQKSQGNNIQQQQSQKGTQKESSSTNNKSNNKKPSKKKKRIPFPKMTPGRQRNYRPPHVISALQSSSSFGSHEKYTSVNDAYNDRFSIIDDDINANGDSGIGVGREVRDGEREEEMNEEEDGCDADDIREHCLENFRDGVESAQYLSVKGPVSVSPSSTTTDNLEDESSIENFRESTSKKGPSYKEVVDKLSTISKNNESPNSSNNSFRDSTHERKMSVYKDSAFNVPLSEYVEERKKLVEVEAEGKSTSSNSSVIDEELLDEDIVDEENLSSDSITKSDCTIDEEIDKIIRQRKKFEQSIRDEDDMDSVAVKEPSDTRKKEAKVSKPSSLLSIDPKSINIIPVKKGKAEEEGLSPTADDDDDNILKRSSDSLNERSNNTPLPSSGSLFSKWEGASSGSKSFVKMFRGSASYIANHRSTLAVYHIPGELLAWEGFPGLMDDIALTWLLGMKIVLVAGCRHQIDLRLEEEDDEEDEYGGNDKNLGGRVMMSSIRVTDEDTLRVVKEEAGFVRFEIERRLAKSLRLHGGLVKGSESLVGNVVSGNFYSAQPFGVVDGVDYCWTGFPRKVETERIRQVHETHDIVLLTSLGVSPSGEIFNVNSEFLAATVAGSLSASKIIYFNVHGTSFQNKLTDKPVQNLRVSDAKDLLAHYKMKIHPKGFALVDLDGDSPQQSVLRTPGSMETLIKVGYSMVALEKGVKRAHILAPENGALVQELYTRDGCGTLISRDIYDGIRRAEVNDVTGIYDLIDPLVKMGTLVERPKSQLEKEVLSYYVYTRDGLVVATGQLKRFEGGFAEIGCLVVSKDYRRGGRGDAMLGYLERLALQCGAKKVFVLSTQTMEWFVERGFKEVPVESLPPSRQAVYNQKRKSKIYMKEIDGDRDLDAAELWWSSK